MSTRRERTGHRRLWRMGLLALVLAAAPLSGPVLAHGTVLSSNPPALTTVDTAPDQVSVTYSSAFESAGSSLVVTGPNGRQVDLENTRADGDTLTVSLGRARPAGVYVVVWTVTATDGHQDSGGFEFSAVRATGVGRGGPLGWLARLTTAALISALAGSVAFLWRTIARAGASQPVSVRRR